MGAPIELCCTCDPIVYISHGSSTPEFMAARDLMGRWLTAPALVSDVGPFEIGLPLVRTTHPKLKRSTRGPAGGLRIICEYKDSHDSGVDLILNGDFGKCLWWS